MAQQQQQEAPQHEQVLLDKAPLHQTNQGTTQTAVLTFDAWKKYEIDEVDNRSIKELQEEYNETIIKQPSLIYTLNLSTFHGMNINIYDYIYVYIYIYICIYTMIRHQQCDQ